MFLRESLREISSSAGIHQARNLGYIISGKDACWLFSSPEKSSLKMEIRIY
jgi:hypothetical protein